MQGKKGHMTLVNRLVLFFVMFCILLLSQSGISSYQKQNVLEPLEQRTDNSQAISRFLND